MPGKSKFNARKLMELAVDVMKKSISEPRADGNTTPKVGAVIWKPDGTVESACRGELRHGDHAEFTLLERKNRSSALDGSILFATLEPCAPGARNHPKLGCAERIVNARIKEVWIGCLDPHPKVARKGRQFLKDNNVSVKIFDRDLQEVIEQENEIFFQQAEAAAEKKKKEQGPVLSEYEGAIKNVALSDFSNDVLESYRSMLMGRGEHTEAEFHRRLFHQGLLEEEDGKLLPTGFGMLLFGKHPRDVMEQAGVLGTLFINDNEEPKDFDDPIVLTPDQAIQWLKDKLPNPISRTEARRKEINEIYYELIREGLVNALVHRDYNIKQAKIQLMVTDDKTVIRSPGEPMDPITLEQLQSFDAPMLSRNPRLHAVFNTMELAEERGLGLRSMRSRAQEAGLPLPSYRWSDPYLDLTVYRTPESATAVLDEVAFADLSESERSGWQWFSTQIACTSREYAENMHMDVRSARRHLNHFVELGLVRKIGSGPATSYSRL